MTEIRDGVVEALGGQGEGILRHEGKVVFVPGALPGERVRYRHFPSRRRFDHGELLEVVDPSPHRRPTPCGHDRPEGCGGCTLLHAERAGAAEWKARALADLLERAGVPRDRLRPPRLPGTGLGYRNHARFLIERGRLAYVARPKAGVREAREKIALDHCPVLLPELDRLRGSLEGKVVGLESVELRMAPTTGEKLVLLQGEHLPASLDPAAIDAAVILQSRRGLLPFRGLPRIHEVIEGVRLQISATSFFQANTEGAIELVRLVRDVIPPSRPVRLALDLYAGVGLFGLAALRHAGRIIAAETDASALQDLRANAASLKHLLVRGEGVVDALDDLLDMGDIPDVVVADPPRAGMGPEVTRRLAELRCPELLLVSCHSQSLSTDLPPLLAAGYEVEGVVPVDQFGGTHHLESFVHLRRE